jgi:hypothetical protein
MLPAHLRRHPPASSELNPKYPRFDVLLGCVESLTQGSIRLSEQIRHLLFSQVPLLLDVELIEQPPRHGQPFQHHRSIRDGSFLAAQIPSTQS